MTHAELVTIAVRWLRVTQRCGVAFREHYAFTEVPDALGYRAAFSICVECKVSRSDFLRDLRKRSRRDYASRPALNCYYLSPEPVSGEMVIIPPARLPDGWGLLTVNAKGRVSVIAKPRQVDLWQDDRTADQLRTELHRLYLDIRRYHAQGLFYEPLRQRLKRQRAEHRAARLPPAPRPSAEPDEKATEEK